MAGLESIALAVDLIERAGDMEMDSSRLSGFQPETSVPPRSIFLDTPRIVSTDSAGEEEAKSISSSDEKAASGDLPMAHENMSPEMVTMMVESLADDGEFDGPPPPPPEPSEVITKVLDCDVLCGRGGETNHHSGNIKYRNLVKKYQPLYIMSKRRDKPLIASKIVRVVRYSGGRFLRKDKSNTWRDVGNTKAREKTSQALREGAPDLRDSQKGTAKEDQAEARSTTQVSGTIRKVSDNGAEGKGSLLQPGDRSIMETQPGEFDRLNGSPAKRIRLDGPVVHGHGVPQFFAGSPHGTFLHGFLPMAAGLASMPSQTPVTHVISPQSFPATVSAEDDDSRGDNGMALKMKKHRGPRLKLLKNRLQEEQVAH